MKRLIACLCMVSLVADLAGATDRYVAASGNNTPPFDSWTKAATTITGAVNAANLNNAGDTVWITNNGASGLLVRACTIVSNSGTAGAGLCMYMAGTGQNCRVIGNYSSSGVLLSGGGALINCLVANHATGGGVNMLGNGTLINCTVVSNKNSGHGGGISVSATGVVVNCIVYTNLSSTTADYNWYTNGVSAVLYATNTCTTPSLSAYGSGNIASDPKFVNAPAGDYRLAPKSPCIDKGLTMGWMYNAIDLDGRQRVLGGGVDMGVYEYVSVGTLIMMR